MNSSSCEVESLGFFKMILWCSRGVLSLPSCTPPRCTNMAHSPLTDGPYALLTAHFVWRIVICSVIWETSRLVVVARTYAAMQIWRRAYPLLACTVVHAVPSLALEIQCACIIKRTVVYGRSGHGSSKIIFNFLAQRVQWNHHHHLCLVASVEGIVGSYKISTTVTISSHCHMLIQDDV